MRHIYVNEHPRPIGQVTRRWEVRSRRGGYQLGWISWRNGWRRYAFSPAPDTIFEEECLRDIAKFIEDQTREHKKAVAGRRAARA